MSEAVVREYLNEIEKDYKKDMEAGPSCDSSVEVMIKQLRPDAT